MNEIIIKNNIYITNSFKILTVVFIISGGYSKSFRTLIPPFTSEIPFSNL